MSWDQKLKVKKKILTISDARIQIVPMYNSTIIENYFSGYLGLFSLVLFYFKKNEFSH